VVPISGSILDINVVGLKATHSYISDLVFMLKSPISTIDTLLNSLCTNEDNLKINLDDESASLYSSIPCPPTDSLTYKPFRALSMYDAAAVNGTWQLQVNDLFNTDGGSLTNWGLNVCYVVTCNMSASTTNTSTSCPSLSNGTATVTPINGVAPYTYLWSNSQTTSMSTNLGIGAYSVVVTDAQGCTASSSATISSTSNAPNQPSNFTTSTTTICSGGTYTYAVPTVANATSYTWAYSGNGASFTSTTNTVSITFNSSPTAGTLSVTANNSCGNSTARNISLSIGNNPIAPIVFANTNPICSGASTTLGSNVSTVSWFFNGSNTAFSTSSSPTVSNAGTYVAVNTTICGSATSNTITLGVTSLPAAPSVTSPVTYCTGATTIALVATGTSLKWYTVSTGGTASSTAPTPSASSSGTTPYYVSQTVNGCEGPRAQINVVVNQTPATPTISIINGGVNPFCFGSSITLSSSSATGNTWNTNATTQTIVANATASYSLTVTTNGCTSSQASLTVTEKPEIVAVINGVLNTCASSTNLSATQIIGYPVSVTYEWIFPDNSLTYGINKTATSSGTYSLNVYANDNCPFAQTSASVTVGNGVAPSIIPSGPTTFCSGGNVTLTASTGTSYLWSTGAISQSIVVSTTGNYNVTVTNGACSATTSNTPVTVNSIPTASISPSSGTITCSNPSINLIASGGGTYLWNNNSNSATRTVTAGGTYSVVVTN
jgi:subtilisin-like proprotein convertase family protein